MVLPIQKFTVVRGLMELTQEQIELAAQASYNAQVQHNARSQYASKNPWPNTGSFNQEAYRVGVRAAAPFLQMSWDEPSTAEAYTFAIENPRFSIPDTSGFDVVETMRRFLSAFIRYRNSELIPKPVDPRREKIMKELSQPGKFSIIDAHGEVADRIIAALDAKE